MMPDEIPAPLERRQNERYRSTYLHCCVVADGEMMLGLIRNVSTGGVRIEIEADLEVGTGISYFCETHVLVPGTIVWRSGNSYGVRHLERDASTRGDFPVRSVRVPCRAEARVWVRGACHSVWLDNISLGGVRVTGLPDFRPGTLCTVEFCGLQFELMTIRWSKDGSTGLRFAQRFNRDYLARLLEDKRLALDSVGVAEPSRKDAQASAKRAPKPPRMTLREAFGFLRFMFLPPERRLAVLLGWER
jgi:hypothetical protein